MSKNKIIHRESQGANQIFNQRSLEKDYKGLKAILKDGLRVLDIGCGTGAITRDIANHIAPNGFVVGIDNTEQFINEGKEMFVETKNLELVHADILDFQTTEKFDLIISARTLQWISTLEEVVDKIKSLLKPSGQISILDYNHEEILWSPSIPDSMQSYYKCFLKWRSDAGMNNRIGDEIAELLDQKGFTNIRIVEADEHYVATDPEALDKLSIWSKVANSPQTSDEGYIGEKERLQAIEDYDLWIAEKAISMTMKLKETTATL